MTNKDTHMNDLMKKTHYPDVTETDGVQDEPLFWDYVGKPIYDIDAKIPIYTIDISIGISFKIETIKKANYSNIIDAHQNGDYSKRWLYFREKNDANRFIKKIKQIIEDYRFKPV